jgi:putative transcriptional regulator
MMSKIRVTESRVDSEMLAFEANLMEAVQEIKTGRAARATKFDMPEAMEARLKVGLNQSQFASLLGVSVRTLQNWEQRRTQPNGAARTLLRVASMSPRVLQRMATIA